MQIIQKVTPLVALVQNAYERKSLKSILEGLYEKQKLSLEDISKRISKKVGKNILSTTVYYWLRKYGIKPRIGATHKQLGFREHELYRQRMAKAMRGGAFLSDIREGKFICGSSCMLIDICPHKNKYFGSKCILVEDQNRKILKPIKKMLMKRDRDNPAKLKANLMLVRVLSGFLRNLFFKQKYIDIIGPVEYINQKDPISGKIKEVRVPNVLSSSLYRDIKIVLQICQVLGVTNKENPSDLSSIIKKMDERQKELKDRESALNDANQRQN